MLTFMVTYLLTVTVLRAMVIIVQMALFKAIILFRMHGRKSGLRAINVMMPLLYYCSHLQVRLMPLLVQRSAQEELNLADGIQLYETNLIKASKR
ncbi:hypothetical protein AFK63_17945 [Cronobacter muytjensii ATCC 51329]|nr:hypothetical protein AFK63_17945 [Cronobacter muytjensii ATCC 51329]